MEDAPEEEPLAGWYRVEEAGMEARCITVDRLVPWTVKWVERKGLEGCCKNRKWLMAEMQGDLVVKRMDPRLHFQASDACYAISLPGQLGQVASPV